MYVFMIFLGNVRNSNDKPLFQTVIHIEQSTWCHVPEDWGLYVNTVSFSPLCIKSI